ncbi:CHAT domain-containing protein [Candidatus Parabeggiatoa sp. HSG14]|uniref:CHAT domain-containing protein n=1 Tax=Candidatus Parabeggiatoa sp. HSG14 TaxID=3055593 RepID=UPI0025A69DC9|nr:CHAT domain-containing protein [Thiotrichales bacterium HSG14]
MRFFILQIIACLCSLFIGIVYAQSTQVEFAQQAFQQGQFELAEKHWQFALAELSETSSEKKKVEIKVLRGLALTYQKMGFYNKALENLQKALDVANQIKDKFYQALIFGELGDFYLITQNIEIRDKGETSQCNLPKTENATNTEKKICAAKANKYLQKAEIIARELDNPQLLAQVLNKQGNRFTICAEHKRALYKKAIAKYQESEQVAIKADDSLLIAKAKINHAEATFLQKLRKLKNPESIKAIKAINVIIEKLWTALQATRQLPASRDKSFGLISLSRLAIKIIKELKKKDSEEYAKLQRIAYDGLQEAKKSAKEMQDNIVLSYVYGRLGELYYYAERYTETVFFTRQALSVTQSIFQSSEETVLSEIVYRWLWQLGRAFKKQNKLDEAIKVYKLAVENLHPIRHKLVDSGYRGQRQQFSNAQYAQNSLNLLYMEFIDLQLQQYKIKQETIYQKEQQALLKDILYTLERYKVAQLQNYFQEECLGVFKIGQLEDKINHFIGEKAKPQIATLYPILISKPKKNASYIPLNEQAKLLVSISKGLFLFSIPDLKRSANVDDIAFQLRNQLIIDQGEDFQENAHQLYKWLIQPIENFLEQHSIKTILMIPDGALRTIPFSVLYDGKKYLIEKYAIGTTQGLALTSLEELSRKFEMDEVFLGGISEAVQGFSALPKVPWELKEIEKSYPNPKSKKLLNKQFSKTQFEQALESNRYKIVHVASHGEFQEDPRENFLLTYDGKITIDRLEKLIKIETSKTVVELLALSACETAQGSKAALGLAGIAVKTGVKSALANLWKVDDEAGSQLSVKFYENLQKENMTAVQALQQAQLDILKKKPHPYYWASMLLIGNWR